VGWPAGIVIERRQSYRAGFGPSFFFFGDSDGRHDDPKGLDGGGARLPDKLTNG
jgi:hypothetical protein